MEITLTKMGGKMISNATFTQIKDAFLEVFRCKGSGRGNYITIANLGETELEIYLQSLVLTDYGRGPYDGPGGDWEIYMGRYEEGTILPVLEEVSNLLDGNEIEKLKKLLKTLPKPKD